MASKGIVPTGRGEEIVLSESTFRSQQRTIQNGVLPGQKAGQKRKREGKGDSSTVFGANAYKGPWAKFKERTPEEEGSGSEVEVTDYSEEDEEEGAKPALPKLVSDYAPEGQTETSEFHGSEMYDYQGRTYMHVPQDLDVNLINRWIFFLLPCLPFALAPLLIVHCFHFQFPSPTSASTQSSAVPYTFFLALHSISRWTIYLLLSRD